MSATTLAASVATSLLTVASLILVARALGPSGRGKYQLAVTLALAVVYVVSAGTSYAEYRLWARRLAHPSELAGSSFRLAFSLGTVGLGVGATAYILGRNTALAALSPAAAAISLATVPLQIHILLLSILYTLAGRLSHNNRARLGAALLNTFLACSLFASGTRAPELYLLAWTMGLLLQWGFLATAVRVHFDRPVGTHLWRLAARQLRLGLALSPSVVFNYLLLRIDTFLVALYLGTSDLGMYAVAVGLSEVVFLATDSLAVAVSEPQANESEPDSLRYSLRAIRLSVLLAVTLGLLLASGAVLLVPLAFGNRFSDSIQPLRWLLLANVGIVVWRTGINILLRFGSPWLPATISLLAVGTNVALNLLLLQPLGIVGGALASCVSYWLGAAGVCSWLVLTRRARFRDLIPSMPDVQLIVGALSVFRGRSGSVKGVEP